MRQKKGLEALAVRAACLAMLICSPTARAQARARPIVLKGALLIDGTGRPPVENSVLVIAGDKVRAVGKVGSVRIPKGADVRDMSGKTIMPALINLHGHLGITSGLDQTARNYTEENIRSQLEKYLAYGVGTVGSFGQDRDLIYELRDKQRAGKLPGARFFTAGRGFSDAGGPSNPLDRRYHPKIPEEARGDVRELAGHHPDFVKIWVDDDLGRNRKMQPDIYQAIIDEAHRHHLRVFSHEFYLADAKGLLAAGIDGFAHSIRDQPVDSELIGAMKARNVFLIPTLVRDESTFCYAEGPSWLDDPFFQAGVGPEVLTALRSPALIAKFRRDPYLPKLRAAFEMGKKNLKTLSDAGVKIAFGTDSGAAGYRFQGFFEHRELQLMVEAGLTPMQAIVAATGTNAEVLGRKNEFGTLQPGRQADFLVLDANPLEDIHNTEKLSAVWQAGKAVQSVSAKQEARVQPAASGDLAAAGFRPPGSVMAEVERKL
jgi:imidazolonepropionase-like amidohydrolase